MLVVYQYCSWHLFAGVLSAHDRLTSDPTCRSFRYATPLADGMAILGEAMSKCQHLAGVPLKPHRAEDMAAIYLARGVQATTAIEGNTLSTEEVEQIVRRGQRRGRKSREYLGAKCRTCSPRYGISTSRCELVKPSPSRARLEH